MSKEEAGELFNIVDADGLISKARLVKQMNYDIDMSGGTLVSWRNSLRVSHPLPSLTQVLVKSPLYIMSYVQPGLEGQSLLETVKSVKPTILIGETFLPRHTSCPGLSGVGGLFSEDVLTAMGAGTDMPVIFPLSNPTSRAECTAADAQRCTGGRAIFASGSPYPDVEVDGKMVASSQCNNR